MVSDGFDMGGTPVQGAASDPLPYDHVISIEKAFVRRRARLIRSKGDSGSPDDSCNQR